MDNNQPPSRSTAAQQQDSRPPVSAAGKASSWRKPALLLLLILCCLLLAAAITSLAVYYSRTIEDPGKYTRLSTNYSSLLNQLQHWNSDYSNLNNNHSELQNNYNKLTESQSELQSNYNKLNESHSELQSNNLRLNESYSELHSNYSKLSGLQSNYNRLSESPSELQSDYNKLNGSHSELQSNYIRLNISHSKLLQNQSQILDEEDRLKKEIYDLKKNNAELSVKSEILNKYCPLKEVFSMERVCKLCQQDWELFNGKCYFISTDKMNWISSRDNCTSMGADLVIIESEREQHFLYNKIKATKNFYWIGLTDVVKEGVWLWVDSTPLNDNVKYWYKGVADDWTGEDPTGEDCAVLHDWDVSSKSWSDLPCTVQKHGRICETNALSINI